MPPQIRSIRRNSSPNRASCGSGGVSRGWTASRNREASAACPPASTSESVVSRRRRAIRASVSTWMPSERATASHDRPEDFSVTARSRTSQSRKSFGPSSALVAEAVRPPAPDRAAVPGRRGRQIRHGSHGRALGARHRHRLAQPCVDVLRPEQVAAQAPQHPFLARVHHGRPQVGGDLVQPHDILHHQGAEEARVVRLAGGDHHQRLEGKTPAELPQARKAAVPLEPRIGPHAAGSSGDMPTEFPPRSADDRAQLPPVHAGQAALQCRVCSVQDDHVTDRLPSRLRRRPPPRP